MDVLSLYIWRTGGKVTVDRLGGEGWICMWEKRGLHFDTGKLYPPSSYHFSTDLILVQNILESDTEKNGSGVRDFL